MELAALARQRLQPAPAAVLSRLARVYGFPRHGNPRDIFFCAVYVLLSAQTTLEQASAALRELRRHWPTAAKLARARFQSIRKTIQFCGFGVTRTEKIIALAAAVARRARGLGSLRELTDVDLEAELVALPGVGFKSARVIAAMSSLERNRFAIDTHIWRIAQRLGWIPIRRTNRKPTERQADSLEAQLPATMRRQLHACLVALGRDCCQPLAPICTACILKDICANSRSTQPVCPE